MLELLLTPILIAVAVWALLTWLVRGGWAARWALDVPNGRSLHSNPTPRIGGIVLLGVALPSVAIIAPSMRWHAALAAVLAVVSAADDRRGLPVLLRLGVHVAVAVAGVVVYGHGTALWAVVAVLAIIWAINLYNFMDGADGMAGGMTVIGFVALAVAAARAGDPDHAHASLAIAAAGAGFLVCNFHPARVFLGDAGSAPLGYLAAGIGLSGAIAQAWPYWFPVVVFSPFIADATITLGRRVLQRRPVWQAHKEHCYQRMVESGMGHAATALAWYALMAAAAATALAALSWPPGAQYALVAAWTGIYLVLSAWIRRRARPAGSA